MTLTPRQAIDRGQVWLRPFGHFKPREQGYMGFSSTEVRDAFYDRMEDGALVIIWTRRHEGEAGWIGKFRGILQLKKEKGPSNSFSSSDGIRDAVGSSRDFSHAVRAIRAWEAAPYGKVSFQAVAPSIWPGKTQSVGHRSAPMQKFELPNLERLKVREVAVWPTSGTASATFEEIRSLFK